MQALKRWVKDFLESYAIMRPDWDEWWENFKKYYPVSAQIIYEFNRKYRRKLSRVALIQDVALIYGETGIKLFQDYFSKRVFELRKDPNYASLFRRRGFRKKQKKLIETN